MIEEILCEDRRQIRSIVSLCEEFGVRRLVQNLPIRTILVSLCKSHGIQPHLLYCGEESVASRW